VIVESLVIGPFEVNTYVLYLDGGHDAVVIDPGDAPREILELLSRHRLNVTHVINTHGHGDHIAGNAALKAAFPGAKICVHPRDAHMLSDANANLSAAFGFSVTSPEADLRIEGNTELAAAGIAFRVEHVPGHSPGSVCLVPLDAGTLVFSGDTLFAGSIGRTDLPGGNTGLLLAGIRDKILSLPDETVVYPGHGVKTTVGVEKRENPFVGAGGL